MIYVLANFTIFQRESATEGSGSENLLRIFVCRVISLCSFSLPWRTIFNEKNSWIILQLQATNDKTSKEFDWSTSFTFRWTLGISLERIIEFIWRWLRRWKIALPRVERCLNEWTLWCSGSLGDRGTGDRKRDMVYHIAPSPWGDRNLCANNRGSPVQVHRFAPAMHLNRNDGVSLARKTPPSISHSQVIRGQRRKTLFYNWSISTHGQKCGKLFWGFSTFSMVRRRHILGRSSRKRTAIFNRWLVAEPRLHGNSSSILHMRWAP